VSESLGEEPGEDLEWAWVRKSGIALARSTPRAGACSLGSREGTVDESIG
jgi:hypothetical protein